MVPLEAIASLRTWRHMKIVAVANHKGGVGKSGVSVCLAGALAEAAQKLAAAKVNVEYIYGSAARKGQPSTIVIGVSDIERAAKVKL